jgi:endonuclease YncB( thermonuclease family)
MLLLFVAQLALSHVRVIDADTVRANGETYRLYGIDAPEAGARARCDAERELAEVASARLRERIAQAEDVIAIPAYDPRGRRVWPRDRYGRRLARIEVDGSDVGSDLVAEGLAQPWPHGAPKPDWC